MPGFRRAASTALIAIVLALATAEAAQGAIVIRGVFRDPDYRWRPRSVSVERGTRIVWRAVEGNHNVIAYGGNWTFARDLPEGERVRRTFRSRGTFRYYCSLHGRVSGGICTGMCGVITVG